ncbi:hypothetical protein BC829DRAFT_381503, partial [Chytridium lagenaria]
MSHQDTQPMHPSHPTLIPQLPNALRQTVQSRTPPSLAQPNKHLLIRSRRCNTNKRSLITSSPMRIRIPKSPTINQSSNYIKPNPPSSVETSRKMWLNASRRPQPIHHRVPRQPGQKKFHKCGIAA